MSCLLPGVRESPWASAFWSSWGLHQAGTTASIPQRLPLSISLPDIDSVMAAKAERTLWCDLLRNVSESRETDPGEARHPPCWCPCHHSCTLTALFWTRTWLSWTPCRQDPFGASCEVTVSALQDPLLGLSDDVDPL